MIKNWLFKLIVILLIFACGYLTCLFLARAEKSRWRELEADRAKQIEQINRMIEQMNEDCEEMVTYNEEAVVRPEEGK